MFLDVFLDSVKDVLKMLPVMFAVCLAGEMIMLRKKLYIRHGNSIAGVLAGALFGLIPQCGVPVGCAQLYVKKMIGTATVITVFLASSDEALIIAAGSYDFKFVLLLMAVKVIAAVVFGAILLLLAKKEGDDPGLATESLILEEKATSAADVLVKTAVNILYLTVYVLITVFLLNYMTEIIGLEEIQRGIAKTGLFQAVVTALIGIVPSCASSVLVTESYMSGIIGFGALISGLCANTGFGIIVIFKSLPLKKALSFTGLLLGISMFTGTVIMAAAS